MEKEGSSSKVGQRIAKTTISNQPMDYCENSDSNLNYNYEDHTKAKEEVEDPAGDDYYTSVSDPLENEIQLDIKDELENNLIRASAAESYTTNVVDPDRVDQEILTAERHPTSESSTTVPELNNQDGEEIIYHDERNQSVTTSKNSHFSRSSDLAKHKRSHSGDKPHVCDVCHKTFGDVCDLVKHKRTHTGEKPYVCYVCQKAFSQSSNLVVHERTHTGSKPYVCNVCLRAFSQLSNLATHERSHTGDKPHVCDVCHKTFSAACHLVQHIRIHTGEKPYVCNVCQKAFRQLVQLVRHERTHKSDK